jgi:hypothetical protein
MSTVKIKVWLMQETPRAVEVSAYPPATAAGDTSHCVWLPLSLIEHISKRKNPDCVWPEAIITLPPWKMKQAQLEKCEV